MRYGRAIALAVLGFALALPALESACAFALPRAICRANDLDGLTKPNSSELEPKCQSCLEDLCCDDVGYCQDDKTNECETKVKAAHSCVVDAGVRGGLEESTCRDLLGKKDDQPHAHSMYTCMRDRCGTDCQLPVCKLDPAALQFGTPSCDRCVSSSCCDQVNACYGSRTCKLSLECIVKNCISEIATDFTNAEKIDLAAAEDRACKGRGDGPDGISTCINKCISDFIGSADEEVEPSQRPGCLAFKVFSCGARAKCGADCTPLPSDAGTDAPKDAPQGG